MAPPSISADAALSFLKDTRGTVSWTIRDLTEILKIDRSQAEQFVALLEAQGYVAREEKNERITTAAGEGVSSAKVPRFSHESIELALAALKERIAQINRDRNAMFRISRRSHS